MKGDDSPPGPAVEAKTRAASADRRCPATLSARSVRILRHTCRYASIRTSPSATWCAASSRMSSNSVITRTSTPSPCWNCRTRSDVGRSACRTRSGIHVLVDPASAAVVPPEAGRSPDWRSGPNSTRANRTPRASRRCSTSSRTAGLIRYRWPGRPTVTTGAAAAPATAPASRPRRRRRRHPHRASSYLRLSRPRTAGANRRRRRTGVPRSRGRPRTGPASTGRGRAAGSCPPGCP